MLPVLFPAEQPDFSSSDCLALEQAFEYFQSGVAGVRLDEQDLIAGSSTWILEEQRLSAEDKGAEFQPVGVQARVEDQARAVAEEEKKKFGLTKNRPP